MPDGRKQHSFNQSLVTYRVITSKLKLEGRCFSFPIVSKRRESVPVYISYYPSRPEISPESLPPAESSEETSPRAARDRVPAHATQQKREREREKGKFRYLFPEQILGTATFLLGMLR